MRTAADAERDLLVPVPAKCLVSFEMAFFRASWVAFFVRTCSQEVATLTSRSLAKQKRKCENLRTSRRTCWIRTVASRKI